MRGYILTERDRRLIKSYLESDIRLHGFSVMIHDFKRIDMNRLREDLALLEWLNRRLEQNVSTKSY